MIATMGIDPGVSGGLVVLTSNGQVYHAEGFQPGMAQTALVAAVQLGLDRLRTLGSGAEVFIEKVGYIGGSGPKCPACGRKKGGDGGQGSNTFGRVDGLLRGAVLMWISENCVGQLHEVAPMFWQAKLECLTGGNKNISKNKAKELWPETRWTHAIADAALIAEYGRRRMAL